jgi:hypothetical protein
MREMETIFSQRTASSRGPWALVPDNFERHSKTNPWTSTYIFEEQIFIAKYQCQKLFYKKSNKKYFFFSNKKRFKQK